MPSTGPTLLANDWGTGETWIAADRASGRVAVTGHHGDWLAMLKFDEESGALSIDEAFGKGGAIALNRPDWPHNAKGKAIVHGVLFSR
ncbi:MAG: hypothetical protein ABIO29_05475 [Sphingomicrobium sp.]